jgi:crossover junction endodeoxyribonuclease RusA
MKIPYPPKELMPNRKNGSHWATTKKIKTQAKNEAYIIALQHKPKIPLDKESKYKLSLIYYQSDNRHRDLDNLLAASKPQIDGIAQALGIDDRQFAPISIDRAKADEFYVEVKIF